MTAPSPAMPEVLGWQFERMSHELGVYTRGDWMIFYWPDGDLAELVHVDRGVVAEGDDPRALAMETTDDRD